MGNLIWKDIMDSAYQKNYAVFPRLGVTSTMMLKSETYFRQLKEISKMKGLQAPAFLLVREGQFIPHAGKAYTQARKLYAYLIKYAKTFPSYRIVFYEYEEVAKNIAMLKNITRRRAKKIFFKYYVAKSKAIIARAEKSALLGEIPC